MDSLRPYLKQTNIFVTNVPRSVPFITLKAYRALRCEDGPLHSQQPPPPSGA
jgi:hypothetical protein